MKQTHIRTIAMLAVFTAVSIILSRFLGIYVTPSLRLSFEYFPIILAGICFGPAAGAVVGGLSDFLGATVLSGLGFFPPLIAGPILAGLTSGLMAKYFFHNDLDKWWKYILIGLAADLLCNFVWGSYALSLLTGTPFLTLLALRAPLKAGIAVADSYLVFAVHRAILPVLLGKNFAAEAHEH
ncbi:MAG: folate family ECF transporter S component [Clostridiales bacterium]|nr:folate family ECF transporter S component [Clostridiales bacterium]